MSEKSVPTTFSIPPSLNKLLDQRARSLKISRSDYIKILILQDLDRGPLAPLELRPRRAIGIRLKKTAGSAINDSLDQRPKGNENIGEG